MVCDSLTLLLQGIQMSTYPSGESVLHKAMVGMLTYEASVSGWWSARGSVTSRRRGSLKAAWIWLVNVPGVKRPWKVVAPVQEANFSTALYRGNKVVSQLNQTIFATHFWTHTKYWQQHQQLWLRSLSNPRHRTAVLMVLAKTRPIHSGTLPTPKHRRQCLALTVCVPVRHQILSQHKQQNYSLSLRIVLYLSSVPRGDDAHVSWVFNGNNGPGCQQQLLPGLLQVDDVHTCQLSIQGHFTLVIHLFSTLASVLMGDISGMRHARLGV